MTRIDHNDGGICRRRRAGMLGVTAGAGMAIAFIMAASSASADVDLDKDLGPDHLVPGCALDNGADYTFTNCIVDPNTDSSTDMTNKELASILQQANQDGTLPTVDYKLEEALPLESGDTNEIDLLTPAENLFLQQILNLPLLPMSAAGLVDVINYVPSDEQGVYNNLLYGATEAQLWEVLFGDNNQLTMAPLLPDVRINQDAAHIAIYMQNHPSDYEAGNLDNDVMAYLQDTTGEGPGTDPLEFNDTAVAIEDLAAAEAYMVMPQYPGVSAGEISEVASSLARFYNGWLFDNPMEATAVENAAQQVNAGSIETFVQQYLEGSVPRLGNSLQDAFDTVSTQWTPDELGAWDTYHVLAEDTLYDIGAQPTAIADTNPVEVVSTAF